MAAGSFKFKTLMILSFLLIWAVVAAAHVFYYAVVKREESLKETRRIAWREAEIPSLRGRILDKNGVPAAWSELRHNLVLEKIPESRRRRDNLFRGIRRFFLRGKATGIQQMQSNRLFLIQCQCLKCGDLLRGFLRFLRLEVNICSRGKDSVSLPVRL